MPRLAYLFPALLLSVVACTDSGLDSGNDDELDQLLAESRVDCGTLTFDNTAGECPATSAALACFAKATRPHIEQVRTTVEGDPIYEHFFADGTGAIILRDTRADDFGPQEITRIDCADGISLSQATEGDCQSVVCR